MYYYFKTDSYGFIHSIDNCILFYFLNCSISYFLNYIHEKGSFRSSYYENKGLSKSSKYNFFQNHIHYDDGIYLKVGRYPLTDAERKRYDTVPCCLIEVNPNKHSEKESFSEILDIIKEYCTGGELKKYDYAIDLPCKLHDVQIFHSRKEKGLYKGTRYFGQRNKNGFCKIYDKTKESGLGYDLTRIEHTCVHADKLSLEKFYFLSGEDSEKIDSLSNVLQTIAELSLRLKSLGADYEDILDHLGRNSRLSINKALLGGYTEYVYDPSILTDLIIQISKLFHLNYVDADGFIQVDDTPLPFV